MSLLIDLHDVPEVAASDLMRVMQKLIASEHGLILLKGLNEESRSALEDAIWATFSDQPQTRLALLLRFESVIEIFSHRRLKDLFTSHGLALLTPAFEVASQQRLNKTWGFNPQKFLMAVLEQLNQRTLPQDSEGGQPAPTFQAQQNAPQLAA